MFGRYEVAFSSCSSHEMTRGLTWWSTGQRGAATIIPYFTANQRARRVVSALDKA